MYIEQLYTGCLSEAAYYIESEGEAIVIDPLRETEPYLKKAEERGAKIKYIFETHFHADFVSGHVDLAKATGASIVFGPTASTDFDSITAEDGQEFSIGGCKLRVLHTPGHTFESSCFLLSDEQGEEKALFTGDTLFIGDVGRPDLAVKSAYTKEDLAGMLYDSLRNKIMPLADEVIVYPAHGAGSACGKNMSKETFDTLGNQKQVNYALQDISREDFIKELTEGILPPPQYFPKAAMMNRSGYKSIDEVQHESHKAMSVEEMKAEAEKGALILDTRHQDDFRSGHVPNSMYIGIHGSFAVWAGALIEDMHQPIVVIADEDKENEVVVRLARVGYDNVIGFLQGGYQSWKDAGQEEKSLTSMTAEEFAALEKGSVPVLDVRKPGEYNADHAEVAESFPLDYFNDQLDSLPAGKNYHIHCKSGYRSVIAASLMLAKGHEVMDIMGGYDAMTQAGVCTVETACTSGK